MLIRRVGLAAAGAVAAAGLAAVVVMLSPTAFGMGGEDVTEGRPWHHLDMTVRALAGDAQLNAPGPARYPVPADVYSGIGFSPAAAMSIAWHADYIDSYLYNPIWWMQGAPGSRRFKTSLTMFDDLARMHHDDTFTMVGVRDNWERYTSGALIGLVNAADRNDLAAAHQIIGIASHAAQDFYSHSNWMDAIDRRSRTWFEYPAIQRTAISRLDIKTGAYEHPSSQAPFNHGAYSMSCSLINGTGLAATLSELCGGVSPIQNTSLCLSYRSCRSGAPVDVSVADQVVSGVVYLQPRGAALDTTWLARVGAQTRSIAGPDGAYLPGKGSPRRLGAMCPAVVNYGATCTHSEAGDRCTSGGAARTCAVDTDYLFAETKDLAIRTTMQFVTFLGKAMRDVDPSSGDKYEVFWNRVMSEPSPYADRTQQFEDFSRVPFQFMSAGPYPVGNPATSVDPFVQTSSGWYLRVRLKTANDALSGTDADIRIRVDSARGGSQTYLLDYLRTSNARGRTDNRLLVYNDFEQGDNDVYTVGPMSSRPTGFTLINDDAGAGDVLDAAWSDFKSAIETVATTLRKAAIGIIGGNADLVGTAQKYYDYSTLVSQLAGAASRDDVLDVNGGAEGRYRVHYSFRFVDSELTAQQRSEGWHSVQFTLNRLECVKESDWDRGSDSDEPFFFFSFAPLNGLSNASVAGYRAGPFDDVDTGESRGLGGSRTFTFRIPPYGGVTLAMQHWESDDENSSDRDELYQTFVTGLDEDAREENTRLLDAVGAAIAADWKLQEIEVLPFLRGPRPLIAPRLIQANVGWIRGGEERRFTLSSDRPMSLVADTAGDINSWSVPSSVAPPSLGTIAPALQKQEVRPLDGRIQLAPPPPPDPVPAETPPKKDTSVLPAPDSAIRVCPPEKCPPPVLRPQILPRQLPRPPVEIKPN